MRAAGRAGTLLAMLAVQMLVASVFAQSPDDTRILCKSTIVSATRLPQPRTCRTMAQWRELERQRERERSADGQSFRQEEVASQPPRPPSPQ